MKKKKRLYYVNYCSLSDYRLVKDGKKSQYLYTQWKVIIKKVKKKNGIFTI